MLDKTLLCISMTPWKGDYLKSTVELMKGLTSYANVVFVDYQYTWKDVFSGAIGSSKTIPWKKIVGIEKRYLVQNNVTVFTPPPIIPSFWIKNEKLFDWVNTINQKIILKSIQRFLRKTNVKPNTVLTAFNPFVGLGVENFFPKLPHIYYCYDDISEAHWLKTHGGRLEKKLMKQVDACIFTSEQLKELKGTQSKKTYLIKNGVDTVIFKPFAKKYPYSDHSLIKVGYVGSIDDRLDHQLIKATAEICPSVEFHFIGRVVHPEIKEFLKHPSIRFHPSVSIPEVPSVMAKLDIGIIPYVKNKFTKAIYPLKINEYLAVGLPVIMTSFAELKDFDSVVSYANTPDEFKKEIEDAALTDSSSLINQRVLFASENSWSNRSKDLYSIIFNE